MADKIKDADDAMLEALFRSEPIADDGFSERIVGRIRRRLWLRRISLPVAAIIGGSIAIKPMSALVASLYGVFAALPTESIAASTSWLPPWHLIVLGAMLLVTAMFGFRLLEE